MSVRSFLPLAAVVAPLTLLAAGCAPTSGPGPWGPPSPAAFNVADFAWSSRPGQASINGLVDYRREGRAYSCTGAVALTPDTPYTRQRFSTLYGSVSRAAVPEAVVRARTVPDPNADYRSFVRSETCEDGRFRFTGLPNGGWFIIVPVSAGDGERIVLMRRVETRGGRTVSVTL